MPDDTLLVVILKWSWTVLLGVFGWIGRGMYSDIKELKKSDSDCKLQLANFKTHVSDTYAKESNVQASLSRIHDRIDEVGHDIKTILSTMKR